MSEKKQLTKIVTPVGVAKYPWLSRPNTKFDEDGKYGVDLILPEAEASKLMTLIDEAHAKNLEEVKKEQTKKGKKVKECDLPYVMEMDSEGNETGNVIFKFKSKARGERKDGTTYEVKIALFDAKGNPITRKLDVFSGSRIKVAALLNPYYVPALGAGVSLRLTGAQIITLSSGNRTASDFGFDAEEDGFTVGGSDFESGGYDEDDEEDTAAEKATDDSEEDF